MFDVCRWYESIFPQSYPSPSPPRRGAEKYLDKRFSDIPVLSGSAVGVREGEHMHADLGRSPNAGSAHKTECRSKLRIACKSGSISEVFFVTVVRRKAALGDVAAHLPWQLCDHSAQACCSTLVRVGARPRRRARALRRRARAIRRRAGCSHGPLVRVAFTRRSLMPSASRTSPSAVAAGATRSTVVDRFSSLVRAARRRTTARAHAAARLFHHARERRRTTVAARMLRSHERSHERSLVSRVLPALSRLTRLRQRLWLESAAVPSQRPQQIPSTARTRLQEQALPRQQH